MACGVRTVCWTTRSWSAWARAERPTLIIAGGSAYPRAIDFARIRAVADEVGALFLVDMAHYARLVATGLYPSPFPHAHIATTTTHKTLRGPRGGMILTNDEDLAKKLNSAVFPGLQGGPLMHVIAAKAAAFGEALRPEFRTYQRAVLDNARVLGETLRERGCDIVTGGTDCHLVLVDLRPKNTTGKAGRGEPGARADDRQQERHPVRPGKARPCPAASRLGSPAATTRGFGTAEFRQVGEMINEVLEGLSPSNDGSNGMVEQAVAGRVRALCARFPIY